MDGRYFLMGEDSVTSPVKKQLESMGENILIFQVDSLEDSKELYEEYKDTGKTIVFYSNMNLAFLVREKLPDFMIVRLWEEDSNVDFNFHTELERQGFLNEIKLKELLKF